MSRMPRTTSSTSPRRARAAASCSTRSACATSCCCPAPTRTPRRSRPSARGELPAAYVRARDARQAAGGARAAGARAACRRRRSCAPTPRWRSAGASSASRPTPADARATLRRAVGPHAPRAHRGGAWPTGRRDAARAERLARALRADCRRASIARYVASGEPFGKAGAYAIQSARRRRWIERIDGSYSGIMGLPLFETAQLLQAGRRAASDRATPRRYRLMQDILINWAPQETRVAIVENGAVQELHVERALERGLVGNIYPGRWRACCPACRRPSSTSASSAPPSCTWPTCTRSRRAARERGDSGNAPPHADRDAWCSRARR